MLGHSDDCIFSKQLEKGMAVRIYDVLLMFILFRVLFTVQITVKCLKHGVHCIPFC